MWEKYFLLLWRNTVGHIWENTFWESGEGGDESVMTGGRWKWPIFDVGEIWKLKMKNATEILTSDKTADSDSESESGMWWWEETGKMAQVRSKLLGHVWSFLRGGKTGILKSGGEKYSQWLCRNAELVVFEKYFLRERGCGDESVMAGPEERGNGSS